MMDAKIIQLESRSKNCSDIGGRAEIDAQIAYHASRIGRFDLARNIIDRIRSEAELCHPPSVAIWIILAEGILAYFEKLDIGSSDRFRRAHALSAALSLNDLRALSSAWLAHADFGLCKYDSMVNCINDCLFYNRAVGNLASSRVGLVLADSYLYSGDLAESRRWYEAARQSAILDGDRATLGAIMYNRAAVALARYRVDHCLSLPHVLNADVLSGAVLSASSFHTLTSNKVLNQLQRMCEARLAMIEDRFDVAVEIFDSIREVESGSLAGVSDKFFGVEYTYCLVRLGRMTRSEFLCHDVDVGLAATLDCDDRVVFLSELLSIYKEFAIRDLIPNTSELLKGAVSAYVDDTKRLQTALQGIVYSENKIDD